MSNRLSLSEENFIISRDTWEAMGLHPYYYGCGRSSFLENNIINLQHIDYSRHRRYVIIVGVHHVGYFETREDAQLAISYLVLHGGTFGHDMTTKKG